MTILDSHIWPQSLARKIKRESGKDKASSRIIVLAADENSPGPDKFRWMQDVPHEDMLCSECEAYSHRIETPALNMLRREILPHLRHMRSNNGIIPLVRCRLDRLAALTLLVLMRSHWSIHHPITKSFSLPARLQAKIERSLGLPRKGSSAARIDGGFYHVHYGAQAVVCNGRFSEGLVSEPVVFEASGSRPGWMVEWIIEGIKFLLLLDVTPEELGRPRPAQKEGSLVEVSRGNFFSDTTLGQHIVRSEWFKDQFRRDNN